MKKEEGRKMIEELKNKKGFIAALDQSGGSSKKTLSNYGIENVQNDEEMFQKIHEMRSRIIRNEAFTSSHILGVILFKHTMDNPIDGKNTVLYLKEKNIHLFNTPHLNSLSVAELIVNMMITLSRHTYQLDRDLRDKKISTIAPIEYIANEISYKTFGIIGTGDIALKTAKILKNGFHMNIIAYSRSLTNKKADELHITLCKSIDEVFQKSDFINIGVSLNKDTYHLITLEQFKLMKPSAYLINTSRGAIINEEDLYYALTNKLLNGYACDVLENEDLSIKQSLLELDNVFYTPHIGGSTHDCLSRIGHAIFISLVNYFDGKQISNMIC